MSYGSGAVNKSMEANSALLAKRKKQKISYATAKDETNEFTKEVYRYCYCSDCHPLLFLL
jgi:hypothetical protein